MKQVLLEALSVGPTMRYVVGGRARAQQWKAFQCGVVPVELALKIEQIDHFRQSQQAAERRETIFAITHRGVGCDLGYVS